jgi:hypothetical protein
MKNKNNRLFGQIDESKEKYCYFSGQNIFV